MPLMPFLMTPAYRYGVMTPWGGNDLKQLFGKNIPDDRTGESLEVSTISGLESRDQNGKTLTELISQFGEALTGTSVHGTFPLLLKLLNAKDTLSVQVHPDDAYAAEKEGKLGKTEAWYILHAEEGAELVMGVTPGITKAQLHDASIAGQAVEKYLYRVPVHAGETYYIPSGMLHAIGAGIVLYEIQQSSDVTYRFYDWERTDKEGKKRQLHIDKAIDVVNLDLRPVKAEESRIEPGHYRVLDEKYFVLEKFKNYQGVLQADKKRFSILTAVQNTRLYWEGGDMKLKNGQTCLIPADGFDIVLDTDEALLSYPNFK